MGLAVDYKQVGLAGALRRSRMSMAYVGAQEVWRMARHPKLYFSDIQPHPSKTAVIVVDAINGFLAPQARLGMKGVESIFPRMNKVIEAARQEALPVFYLCDGHSKNDAELKNWPKHCDRRTWESQVHPDISQPMRKQEWVFKNEFSAFKGTDLHERLQKLGVEKLIILGVATEYCDEANSTDAVDLGYKVTVVSDSIREVDLKPGDGERAIHRMVRKGITFRDTSKVVDNILRREHQMPMAISPTKFEIGPSVAENARPIVTEEMAGSQAKFTASLNFRRNALPAWLTQTDFYQLVMANLFHQACHGTTPIAHFEAFVRKYPVGRDFMVFSGLHDFLHWMKNARMDEDRVQYVLNQPIIRDSVSDLNGFADYLRNFRFKLDVWSYPEGTFFAPTAPFIGISGPIEQVLLAETYLLSMLNSRSAFSTRAAQYRLANPDMPTIAMEMRRMDASLSEIASFEAFKQGFIGTSNTEAGFQYGINSVGTNSHAMYLAFDREIEAIRTWMDIFPNYPMVLTDTFHALINALKTAAVLQERGIASTSFRTDSGKLAALMGLYERILAQKGFKSAKKIGTNDLTPMLLAEMAEQLANANVVGVGTKYGEVPATPAVLKLSEIDGLDDSRYICKLSTGGKESLPGIHQVWRRFDEDGHAAGDVIALLDERIDGASPLLVPFTSGGYLLRAYPGKDALQKQYEAGRLELPAPIIEGRGLGTSGYVYPVSLTQRTEELRKRVVADIRAREINPYLAELANYATPEEIAAAMGR